MKKKLRWKNPLTLRGAQQRQRIRGEGALQQARATVADLKVPIQQRQMTWQQTFWISGRSSFNFNCRCSQGQVATLRSWTPSTQHTVRDAVAIADAETLSDMYASLAMFVSLLLAEINRAMEHGRRLARDQNPDGTSLMQLPQWMTLVQRIADQLAKMIGPIRRRCAQQLASLVHTSAHRRFQPQPN